MVIITCRYGEDHEPKEPKEGGDEGGAWDDDAALHDMLGAAEGGDGGTDMQSLD
jgi:hypothetical protein